LVKKKKTIPSKPPLNINHIIVTSVLRRYKSSARSIKQNLAATSVINFYAAWWSLLYLHNDGDCW